MQQPKESTRRARTRWGSAAPLALRASVIVAALAALVLPLAGCEGGDRDQAASVSEAWLTATGPPATVEAYVKVRPWASSEWRGKAWGRIWLEETRNPRDLNGRGTDAYGWAIRTCDAVRTGGQSPEAMVRQVRDSKPGFTEQGAKVIVTAALRALCPEDRAPSQLPP